MKIYQIFFPMLLLVCTGLFAQNGGPALAEKETYTFHFSGRIRGTVTIQRDGAGTVTITPAITDIGDSVYSIGRDLCPLIPAEMAPVEVRRGMGWWKAVADGDTTTYINSDGDWWKMVTSGDTMTYTDSDGSWEKTVVSGNTTTYTDSDGWRRETVVDKQGHDVFITIEEGWE